MNTVIQASDYPNSRDNQTNTQSKNTDAQAFMSTRTQLRNREIETQWSEANKSWQTCLCIFQASFLLLLLFAIHKEMERVCLSPKYVSMYQGKVIIRGSTSLPDLTQLPTTYVSNHELIVQISCISLPICTRFACFTLTNRKLCVLFSLSSGWRRRRRKKNKTCWITYSHHGCTCV